MNYLRAILPPELIGFSRLEIAGATSISLWQEGASRFMGFHLAADQIKANNGIRSEVSVDFPFWEGETVSYVWSVKLPSDFVSDAPSNRWWLIGQWHDQPTAGETWATFGSNSPPVSLALGELNGRMAFGVSYGPTIDGARQTSYGPVTIPRGVWTRIAVHVRWSQTASGQVKVFVDSDPRPVVVANGPNMNNGYRHYWKIGMYRHPDIRLNSSIFIKDARASVIAK